MPTTTATFKLVSPDIDAYPIEIQTTTPLYKAGLVTGVDQTSGMNRKIILAADTGKVQLIPTLIGGTFTLEGVTLANTDATVELASSSPTLEALGLKAGQSILGTGVADGATVLSITDADTFEMSANATQDVVTGDGSITVGYNQYTANKANKVYICNSSADDSDYIIVTINTEEIGRLYAGDWMFFPWSAATGGVANTGSIFVTAATQTSTAIVDWMVIGEGDS